MQRRRSVHYGWRLRRLTEVLCRDKRGAKCLGSATETQVSFEMSSRRNNKEREGNLVAHSALLLQVNTTADSSTKHRHHPAPDPWLGHTASEWFLRVARAVR